MRNRNKDSCLCSVTILGVYIFQCISNITTKFSNKKVKDLPCPTLPPAFITKIFKHQKSWMTFMVNTHISSTEILQLTLFCGCFIISICTWIYLFMHFRVNCRQVYLQTPVHFTPKHFSRYIIIYSSIFVHSFLLWNKIYIQWNAQILSIQLNKF